MEFDNRKLVEVLDTIMQGMTKKEFALKCGITPESLSRYTKSNNPMKPSRGVLRKIANATGANLEDLLSACGYIEVQDNREIINIFQRARLNIQDMENGFDQMISGVRLYKSLPTFLNEYRHLYSKENVTYQYSKKRDYFGNLVPDAEYCSVVCFTFGKPSEFCRTWMVVYYCETKGGKIVVCGYAMDGKSLADAGFDNTTLWRDNELFENRKYVYLVHERKTAEERILDYLLKSEEYTFMRSWVGFGFHLASVPKNFDQFLMAHEKAFSETEAEKVMVDNCLVGEDPAEVFAEYMDDYTCASGYGAVIAKIIRNETGISFAWWIDEEGGAPAVMLETESDDYRNNEIDFLQQVIYPYAKELGVYEYGTVVVRCEDQIDANTVYHIEENKPENYKEDK